MANKKLKITFALPGAGANPVGGFKVVYEYASHLSRRGHEITVVHPAMLRVATPVLDRSKIAIRYMQRRIDGSYRPDQWFKVDPEVRLMWVSSLAERHVPDADIIVATTCEACEWIRHYSDAKGKRFYLIQGLETWTGPVESVYAIWKMPFKKIVIAQWLKEIALDLDERVAYIPNGLDFRMFGIDVSPENRNQNHIMMLYHRVEIKGSADGLEALSIVKRQVPALRATLFGVPAPPADLPSWIEYHRRPAQAKLRELYNHAAIFLAPSLSEGWPLPPAEAMMSGAALVATDIGGHREYACHEKTALLSPPKEPEILAENILRLIRDRNLRILLAKQGNDYIQQFTWKRAVDQFEALVSSPYDATNV